LAACRIRASQVRDFVARLDLEGGENRWRSVDDDLPAQVVRFGEQADNAPSKMPAFGPN
jgi:hypothetical protein